MRATSKWKLLPQVQWGSLGPYKVCTRMLMAAFLHSVGVLWQCKCIKMNLGAEVEEESPRSVSVVLDL